MQGAEVLTKFTADTKEIDKAEKDVQDGFERTRKIAEVAFAGAVAAIDKMVASFVKGGVEYNAQVETYLTRLTTLTGDSEKAHKILEQIKKDALATPFEVSSLTSAESLLLATGMSAEQSRNDILALGDAIAASGGGNEELSRMAVNMQQIRNVGKATALDIKQFAYAGIDIFGLLADSLGITREEASQLDVTYDMLSDALQKASGEGGKYYQAMQKQSTTYSGAMSNLSESVEVFKGAIAEGLFNALKDLIPKLTDMFDWLTKNKDIVLAIAVPLLTFINIIAGFLIIKKITTAFAMLNAVMMANPIVLIIAAIVALVAGFVYLWNHCEDFRNFWIGLWNGIVDVVVGAWEWIKGLFTGVIDFVSNNWQALLLFLVNPFAGAFKLLYDNCEGFRNFVNGFVNTVVNSFKSIPGKLVSFAQGIVNVFTSIPGKMMNVGKNIVQGLWNGITGLKDWVISKVKNLGKSILNSIKNVLGIHSPSTEFAMIGKFSVLGYTEELDKMTKTVQGQIAETFSVSPQLANSSALHYSPSVNTTVNVSQTQDPLGRVVNDIKTFSGGAKNDYNYGMGV